MSFPQKFPEVIRNQQESTVEKYRLVVNLIEIAQVLKARGVSEEKIGSLQVEILDSESPALLQNSEAVYLFWGDRLIIFAKNVLADYTKLVKLAEDLIEGKTTQSISFNTLLHTNRLGDYLQNEQFSKTRRIKFAMKLLWQGTNTRITPLIAHELQHKIDYEHNPTLYTIILIAEKLLPLVGLLVPKLFADLIEVVTGNELDMELNEVTASAYFFIAVMSMYLIQRYAYLFSVLEGSAHRLENEVKAADKAIILGGLYPGEETQFLAEPWHTVKHD